jgi:biopolymer transport protein ExbD
LRGSHKPTLILLAASLLAAGCGPQPENFNRLAGETAANANLPATVAASVRIASVSVNAERKVFFGKENVGTLEEFGRLKELVRRAAERNTRDGVGNTVFFCAPADFKYGDVVGVIEAIKEVGGSPVGITDCIPPR